MNTLRNNPNCAGITVGHKGSIYYYTAPNMEIIDSDLNVMLLKIKNSHGTIRYEEAMKLLTEKYEFDFRVL